MFEEGADDGLGIELADQQLSVSSYFLADAYTALWSRIFRIAWCLLSVRRLIDRVRGIGQPVVKCAIVAGSICVLSGVISQLAGMAMVGSML